MAGFLRSTWDLLVKGGMMAAGFLSGLKGEGNTSLILLVCLMAADYISGLAAAALHKSDKTPSGGISSAAGWKGLLKKAMMLLVVLVAILLDRTSAEPTHMFQSAVTWFYISNEAISLVENLSAAGVPIPRRFRVLLEQTAREAPDSERAPAEKENKTEVLPEPPAPVAPRAQEEDAVRVPSANAPQADAPEAEAAEAVAVFRPSARRQSFTPTKGGKQDA